MDNEFVRRSYVGMVAAKEFDVSLLHYWDVDHDHGNMLIEAIPLWQEGSSRIWPQIMLDDGLIQFRGDFTDIAALESQGFIDVLIKSARRCIERCIAGEKGWVYYDVLREGIAVDPQYRFAPRAFFRRSIQEVGTSYRNNERQTLVIRGLNERDVLRLINKLKDLPREILGGRYENLLSSHLPVIRQTSRPDLIMRAIFKNAFNCLAFLCENTPVSLVSFPKVVGLIRELPGYELKVPGPAFAEAGFVHAEDVADFSRPKSHVVRVWYHRQVRVWWVATSYFGGAIATIAGLPGPSNETWARTELVLPLNEAPSEPTRSGLIYSN